MRYAEDFSDRDYGRRLQFTASVYDTAVRQLGFTVGATSCVADGEPLVDCRAYFSNYTTRPGEWVDHSFRVDLKNPRALGAFKKNCLTLYGETWGAKNAECPIYLDRISVTETVTAVELSGLALIG